MLPGIPAKRFVRDMQRIALGDPITPKQAAYITGLAWRYRRQMPRRLVPDGATPHDAAEPNSGPTP